jgi:hypothetical protein
MVVHEALTTGTGTAVHKALTTGTGTAVHEALTTSYRYGCSRSFNYKLPIRLFTKL